MKNTYRFLEKCFERVTTVAILVLGNSITFIAALVLVMVWLTDRFFYSQNTHYIIRDIIQSVTFLSLFIIQKSFKRFAASLHLKVNELVSSNKYANNSVINVETKTDHEIAELSKEIAELAEQTKQALAEKQ